MFINPLSDKDKQFVKNCIENMQYWATIAEKYEVGNCWYTEAHNFSKFIVEKYNLCDFYNCENKDAVKIVAQVISALSPQNKWKQNKIDAENLIKAFVSGGQVHDVKTSTFNANKQKAINILNLHSVKWGNKTNSFWRNICLQGDTVTIDLWHLRCVKTGKIENDFKSLTDKRYKLIEYATLKLAKKYGLKGYQLQAIIWQSIREEWIY